MSGITKETKKQAVAFIRSCDELFHKDNEFAYQQVRLLTLELLDQLEAAGDSARAVIKDALLLKEQAEERVKELEAELTRENVWIA